MSAYVENSKNLKDLKDNIFKADKFVFLLVVFFVPIFLLVVLLLEYPELRVQGAEFTVQGSRFRVQGSGFGVCN
jgi:hypothetical protein